MPGREACPSCKSTNISKDKLVETDTSDRVCNDCGYTQIAKAFEFDSSSISKIQLEHGVCTPINVNKPFTFTLRTTGGTVITTTVTPNNPLKITPGDDIAQIDMGIEEESSEQIKTIH